jgi:hypothetical protein
MSYRTYIHQMIPGHSEMEYMQAERIMEHEIFHASLFTESAEEIRQGAMKAFEVLNLRQSN